jgi:uncharacterized Fe-S center protein
MGLGKILWEDTMNQLNNEKRTKVFMTTSVNPAGLLAVYNELGRKAGNKTGVKVSTGEPGGHNFLTPAIIKDVVCLVNGTIVECNTAYDGKSDHTTFPKANNHNQRHNQILFFFEPICFLWEYP